MESITEWQKIKREWSEEFVDQETSSPGSFDDSTPRFSQETNSLTPTLVPPEGDGNPSEVKSSSQVHSEDDDDNSEDSERKSDDKDSSSSVDYQESWNKFAQSYSKSHMQSIILQEWQIFDKEYARIMAKDALRCLKSGINKGRIAFIREEGKQQWVDRKNGTWDSLMMGTKFIWLGDLPKFRLENIRREFISCMNTFDWELEALTFSVKDDGDRLEWIWKIKVPENW